MTREGAHRCPELSPIQAIHHFKDFAPLVRETNGYVEHSAPWAEAKRGNDDRVSTILYHAAETLRIASVLLHPVMPESTVEIWRRLGWERPSSLGNGLHWGSLTPGSEVSSGPPLFPRLDG